MALWSLRNTSKIESSVILITGCPKSGTSLLHNLLSIHKNIQTELIEFDFGKSSIERERILKNCQAMDPNQFYLIKRPNSNFYISVIRKKFHNIKVINMIRDGRDVVYSSHKFFNWPIRFAINTWKHNIKIATKLDSDWNLNIKYEDLVNKTVETLNQIESFIGLTEQLTQEDVNTFYLNLGDTKKIAEQNSTKPIFKSSIGGWKNMASESDKKQFRKIKKELKTWGYE